MSRNQKSVKALLPALGLVFGAGVGLPVSILFSFHIVAGIIGGAALGLIVGLIASNLYGNANNKEKDTDGE